MTAKQVRQKLIIVSVFLSTLFSVFGASGLDTGIRIQDGPEAWTNKTSRVTISGMTNLAAGTLAATNLGAAKIPVTDSAFKFVAATNTGNGNIVLSEAPTIVAPTIASFENATHNHQNAAGGGALSTAALTSGTLEVARGGTGLGSGTSGGILGFTASGTLASSAALAANSVVIGGGAGATPTTTTTAAGFLTWLGTPSSANLISLISDETGSGALVFANSPALAGNPTAPTQTQGDNSTKIATTAYVETAVAGASQTPWTSDIDADGNSLTNVSSIIGTSSGVTVIGNTAGINLTNDAVDAALTVGMPVTLLSNLTATAGTTALGTATATTPSANDNDTSIATTAYVQTELTAYASDTVTFTGKTFDAAGTGNVLKQTKQLILQRPDYGDGAGAVPQTNTFNVSGLMHYTFSGNAETNANWAVYEFDCPSDLDTGVEMTARFAFLSGGTDTDDYVFHLTYDQVAPGAAYPTGTGVDLLPIVMTITPTTPANGDLQESSATTLTGWAAALTPGRPMQVRIARLQNTQDDDARDVQLVITYGSTL